MLHPKYILIVKSCIFIYGGRTFITTFVLQKNSKISRIIAMGPNLKFDRMNINQLFATHATKSLTFFSKFCLVLKQ